MLFTWGYNHSLNDYSLFIKKTHYFTTLISIYIDGIIVIRDDLSEIFTLKAFLDDRFKIKDLGCLTTFWILCLLSSVRYFVFSSKEVYL